MAEQLKTFFDRRVVVSIARDLHRAHAGLDEDAFIADALKGLARLELTKRGWHVADVMRRHLPMDFTQAASIIVASLGPELDRTEGFGMAPFRYMPHAFFIARYGVEHRAPSMQALYELTKRFTAELSIRVFIERYPEETFAQLTRWAGDPNVHVRRLVSEGTRPRLPWAPRLRELQRDPARVLTLLELLKDDDERYVQRSIANNLNDISKDHPHVAVDVCRRWLGQATPGRAWIVSHALRGLVKAGDAAALDVVGFGAHPAVRVERASVKPARLRIGGSVVLAFDVVSTTKSGAQSLLVDYAVYFRKQNGSKSKKVFKLTKLQLPAGERVPLRATVSFADMSTRVHHPGRHRIEALINGVAFPLGAIDVKR